jgi:hypothetical protein
MNEQKLKKLNLISIYSLGGYAVFITVYLMISGRVLENIYFANVFLLLTLLTMVYSGVLVLYDFGYSLAKKEYTNIKFGFAVLALGVYLFIPFIAIVIDSVF